MNPVSFPPPWTAPDITPAATGEMGASGDGFLKVLDETLQQVDSLQSSANQKVADMLQGRGVDVHSAMIAVEKADVAFQLMIQVRNKIVAAYEEISKMQF
jgi:flagellar hook-basal body complex protein FliE